MSRLLMAAAAAALVAPPAPAVDLGFGLFKRKPKGEPAAAKAKQLTTTLGTSPDEAARKQAAEELRSLDPRSNPEVFPALIGALQKDPSPAVRVAAADTVGRLKPVYQPAGIVLDGVAQTDPDPKVREAAQAALFQYHLGGYVTPRGPQASGSAEPPIAARRPTPPPVATFRPITNTVGKGVFYPPTAEPPLAKGLQPAPAAKPAPAAPPPALLPQPMPPALPPIPPPAAPSVPTGPLPPVSVPPAGG